MQDEFPPPPPPPLPGSVGSGTIGGADGIFPSAQGAAPAAPRPHDRARIVVIGRRRAGKTIYLARLYEALWQGCKLYDGVMPPKNAPTSGVVTKMSCRASSGAAHLQFMRIAEELHAGRWPAATLGNSYAELFIDYGGREFKLTALDYPGELFRKVFMGDSTDPDALELAEAIDRAIAAIFLIDPAVVAAGGEEAQEDAFGLTQAAARIRESVGGSEVPIAIVFTKCDLNKALIREAGGVRKFALKHFKQLFRSVDRTSVFASAAVRTAQNSLGKSVPIVVGSPENVVEPLRYCCDGMAVAGDRVRVSEAKRVRVEAERLEETTAEFEAKRATTAWVIFSAAVALLFIAVTMFTLWSLGTIR